MAQNYNILMNRFNGTDHDTLLPKNHLNGTTNPTTSTVGIVGQFYINTTTKQLFQCVTVSGSTYTWTPYYNAEQTLADSTKTKYGLGNTATPNDAFNSLATNMVATRKTYPIATGQTITAKDVVDIVGGAVTKTGTPSQAIALQSGTSPQSIEIIYDGVAPLAGITAGTQITSTGVQGYAPQDGWLWVRPEWENDYSLKMVSGMYTGNGANTLNVSLGFKPSLVLVYKRWFEWSSSNNGHWLSCIGVASNSSGFYLSQSEFANGRAPFISVTETGFALTKWASYSGNPYPLNDSGVVYSYVAFK